MSLQPIKPGGTIEVATPDEIAALIPRPEQDTRIRVSSSVLLDTTGKGQDEVYNVPAGYRFEVRRVVLSLTGNQPADPNTAQVVLTAAGKYVAYLRSGSLIEYAQPFYGAVIQVPGMQSWSKGQGPHLANKETFQVLAVGLTASVSLGVYMEGDLVRPREGGSARSRAR